MRLFTRRREPEVRLPGLVQQRQEAALVGEVVALAYSGSWRDGLSAAAAMNVFGPVLWTSRPALSKEVSSYLLRESASSGQVAYTPYYDGNEPASTRMSSQALRAGAGPSAAARPGPVGADPHLEPFRTVLHR